MRKGETRKAGKESRSMLSLVLCIHGRSLQGTPFDLEGPHHHNCVVRTSCRGVTNKVSMFEKTKVTSGQNKLAAWRILIKH